ncbi:MAG: spore germination protein [Clostridia bacterium]|nr:spore germination protein [Clostridia bacterium]
MKNFFSFIKKSEKTVSQPVKNQPSEEIPDGIRLSLDENINSLREMFGESFDLVIKQSDINGVKIAFVLLDGMYNNLLASEAVIQPVLNTDFSCTEPEILSEYIVSHRVTECDSKKLTTMQSAVDMLISGCLLFFIDGVTECRSFSVQGYPKKSIGSPESETQENGSHEGFGDMYKDNVTLVRRRLKNPYVRFETVTVGETSRTAVCMCYHAGRADPVIVKNIKEKLEAIRLDIVSGAGAIRPFLEEKQPSLFSTTGTTERPDVFAAKIAEGRVGIIVDGTPYALIVPHLFIENFHSLDDYLSRPYYATISRILKILCFFLAVFLPGTYVAVGTFHQEIFPSAIIYDIVSSLENTPFPLVVESLVIHFIYEIVREAGLRMPKTIGHAVSIVGALVIGDAAVSAGLISAPMLIIVAITAICSAVTSNLHQPTSFLRMIFIITGGITGLFGIMTGFALMTVDICSHNSFGIPVTSPLSPFDAYAVRDSVLFAGWKSVGRRFIKIQDLKGSNTDADKS